MGTNARGGQAPALRANRDREVSPTGTSLAARPGGRANGFMKHLHVTLSYNLANLVFSCKSEQDYHDFHDFTGLGL